MGDGFRFEIGKGVFDFKVFLNGEDVTEGTHIKGVSFDLDGYGRTEVKLTVYPDSIVLDNIPPENIHIDVEDYPADVRGAMVALARVNKK